MLPFVASVGIIYAFQCYSGINISVKELSLCCKIRKYRSIKQATVAGVSKQASVFRSSDPKMLELQLDIILSIKFQIPSELRAIVHQYFHFERITDVNIKQAVALWLQNESFCWQRFGHISRWDTSDVTNMSSLFRNASTFNEPLDNWDVSKVTDMNSMFLNATSFNQRLNAWDVSNVRNMTCMFLRARFFLISLSSIGMLQMFDGSSFNQLLDAWDTSSVLDFNNPYDRFRFSDGFNPHIILSCHFDEATSRQPFLNARVGRGSSAFNLLPASFTIAM
jgi:surface protein